MRQSSGDLIEHATQAKQPLPSPENVRTQLDAGLDLNHMPTVGQWLDRWLASRKTLRKVPVRAYSIHIRRWLTPQLGHLPLDKGLAVDLTCGDVRHHRRTQRRDRSRPRPAPTPRPEPA